MNVDIYTRADKFLDEYDYNSFITIKIDGNKFFSVHDGEPEDNNLGRNFGEVCDIPFLMRKAWEAGKNGEEMTTTWHEVENA